MSTSSHVVVVDPVVLPEAQALAVLQNKIHEQAQLYTAMARLVDNQMVDLLEKTTGVDLHGAQHYSFDASKGYLIPDAPALTEEPLPEPIPFVRKKAKKDK